MLLDLTIPTVLGTFTGGSLLAFTVTNAGTQATTGVFLEGRATPTSPYIRMVDSREDYISHTSILGFESSDGAIEGMRVAPGAVTVTHADCSMFSDVRVLATGYPGADAVCQVAIVGGSSTTVDVGTTTTGPPGSAALVTNSGSGGAGVFNFVIPRGDVGPEGPQGDGSVVSVAVQTANGFSGTVASPTTTPAVTLSTTVTGLTAGASGALVAAVAADVNTTMGFTIQNTAVAVSTVTLNVSGVSTVGAMVAGGQVSLGGAAGGEGLRVLSVASAVSRVQISGAVTGSPPSAGPLIAAVSTDVSAALTLTSQGVNGINFQTGGVRQMAVQHTPSAVNYWQIGGGAAGNAAYIRTAGTDANIDSQFYSKGTGNVSMTTAGTGYIRMLTNNGTEQARVTHTASAANWVTLTGGVTGGPVVVLADGTDTNVDVALTTKGSGVLRFGTFTSNADAAVTGYVTIKDASGTLRKLATIA